MLQELRRSQLWSIWGNKFPIGTMKSSVLPGSRRSAVRELIGNPFMFSGGIWFSMWLDTFTSSLFVLLRFVSSFLLLYSSFYHDKNWPFFGVVNGRWTFGSIEEVSSLCASIKYWYVPLCKFSYYFVGFGIVLHKIYLFRWVCEFLVWDGGKEYEVLVGILAVELEVN